MAEPPGHSSPVEHHGALPGSLAPTPIRARSSGLVARGEPALPSSCEPRTGGARGHSPSKWSGPGDFKVSPAPTPIHARRWETRGLALILQKSSCGPRTGGPRGPSSPADRKGSSVSPAPTPILARPWDRATCTPPTAGPHGHNQAALLMPCPAPTPTRAQQYWGAVL